MALFIVSEGKGEEDALPALVYRVGAHHGFALPYHSAKKHGFRLPLLTRMQVHAACERFHSTADCDALLLTRDADQDQLANADCPKFTAPEMAAWVRELRLPFPVAIVLFYKEYETLFIAGASRMAGAEVRDHRSNVVGRVPVDALSHNDPEQPRDAKGWVRDHLVDAYKPTLLQTSLTKMLDLEGLEESGLSSYRRLVNALAFLASNLGTPGVVYPAQPSEDAS